MQGIFSGIQAFLNSIWGPITYLGNLIKMAIQAMGFVYKALLNITSIISGMPSWLTTIAMTTVSIAVVYQLFGRSQGK